MVYEYATKNNPMIQVIIFSSNILASTPSIIFGALDFFVIFLDFIFDITGRRAAKRWH